MLAIVNSPRSTPPILLAPGASSSYVSARAPGRDTPLPPIDERLAVPETHTQVVDGVTIETMGANPPHATHHAAVARIFTDCLAAGYEAAVDMLTRVDDKNDLAPDVSVFPTGVNKKTGGRKLAELTFEVCDSEGMGHVTKKARRFLDRGVRRVFHVRVDDGAVYEWKRAKDAWVKLGDEATITDRCFVVPIPVGALVQRVLADDTVARALLARGNPVIVAAVDAARATGRGEGAREGVKLGRDEGVKLGRDEGLQPLAHQFARRLGRALADGEFARLRERLGTLGAARLGGVVLDLERDALAAWLADDDAR